MAERPLAPLQDLLNAADCGLIKLPDEAVKYRAALDHLGQQLRGLQPVDPGHAELEQAVIAAAMNGTALPDARLLTDRANEQQALEALQTIGRAAHERLEYKVREALTSNPDEVVVKYLRPVHDRVVAEIRKCIQVLDGELDDRALRLASTAKRQARGELDVAVSKYQSVRAAYRALSRYMPLTLDSEGKLMQWKNPGAQGWRDRSVPRQDATVDVVAAFVAQLASGLEPWMPTSAERDERYEVLFPRQSQSGQRNPRIVGVDVETGDRVRA